MPWKLFGLPLVLAGVRGAEVDCGNRHACRDGQTCTSHELGAGLRFGCAPLPLVNICGDGRFACPAGWACDLEAALCRDARTSKTQPLLGNIDAGAPAKAAMHAQALDTFCDVLSPDLPASCTCANKRLGAELFCRIGVLSKDVFGVKAELELCGEKAHLDVEVTESQHGVNFTVAALESGVTMEVPIPGLQLGIPKVGLASVDVSLGFAGSLEKFSITLGLDACATVADKTKCGKDLLPRYFPYRILNETFSFKGLCDPSEHASLLI